MQFKRINSKNGFYKLVLTNDFLLLEFLNIVINFVTNYIIGVLKMIKSKQEYVSDINNIFKNKFQACSDSIVVTDEKRLKNQAFNIFDEVNDEMVKEINKMVELKIDYSVLNEGCEESLGIRNGLVDAIGDVQVFLFGVNHLAGLGDKYSESKMFKTDCVYNHYSEIKIELKGLSLVDKLKMIVEMLNETTNDLMSSIYDGAKITDIAGKIQKVDTVCLVAYEALGANGDIVIKSIAESNFSKVCPSLDNLNKSMEYYRSLGIEVHSIEVEYGDESKKYAVISSKNQNDSDGKYYNENKFLKSIDFKEPITLNW